MSRTNEEFDEQETDVSRPRWIWFALIAAFLCYPLIVFSADEETSGRSPVVAEEGVLRVLHHRAGDEEVNVPDVERAMLTRFAESQGLDLRWIEVKHRWNLLPGLFAGRGDIIAGQGLSLLQGMSAAIEFTPPWSTSSLKIVTRADTTRITTTADLDFRQIAIKQSSPAWPLLQELQKQNGDIEVHAVPESLSQPEILQRVASGVYDLTVADSRFLTDYLPEHPELSAIYDLTEAEARAFGVHSDNKQLQASLNQFLYKHHLVLSVDDVHLGDLPEMKERRTLRVITYQDPAHYYFGSGRFHGFEYELISRFAKSEDMRVDVVLANSHAEMQALLMRGDGDIIAASLPAGSIDKDGIVTSSSYNFSVPVVIGRAGEEPLTDVRDLAGRRITLPASSPYKKHLQAIRDRGIDFEIVEAESSISTRGVLSMVSLGMYDLTLLDNQQFRSELTEEYDVAAQFTLGEPLPHVWAVREESSHLRSSINDFLAGHYRDKHYNVLHAKYFEYNNREIANSQVIPRTEALSPYDKIVRQYAEHYSFDWRLIVAQMYQESQFNPAAVSSAGAEGLMQLMPTTADLVGTKDTRDPEMNIASGVKYLSMLRDRFENDLLLEDRTWFTLASYNAGYGRVKRARSLAEEMGLDRNRWFGNVEKAMLEMARPFQKDGEWIRNCRCGQAVVYVREIRTLYNNYVRLTQATQIAGIDSIRQPPYDI